MEIKAKSELVLVLNLFRKLILILFIFGDVRKARVLGLNE